MVDQPATELVFVAPDPNDPRYAGELELRYQVLRRPLGMGRETVRFAFEDDALHLLAVAAGDLVLGCVLFHPEDATGGRLFQMAVDPALQGRGLGARLVRHLEGHLLAKGLWNVHLHARDEAIGFYERLGYAICGPAFVEVGIGHHPMRGDLRTRGATEPSQ